LKALYLAIHHLLTKLTLAVDATASTIGRYLFNNEKDRSSFFSVASDVAGAADGLRCMRC